MARTSSWEFSSSDVLLRPLNPSLRNAAADAFFRRSRYAGGRGVRRKGNGFCVGVRFYEPSSITVRCAEAPGQHRGLSVAFFEPVRRSEAQKPRFRVPIRRFFGGAFGRNTPEKMGIWGLYLKFSHDGGHRKHQERMSRSGRGENNLLPKRAGQVFFPEKRVFLLTGREGEFVDKARRSCRRARVIAVSLPRKA